MFWGDFLVGTAMSEVAQTPKAVVFRSFSLGDEHLPIEKGCSLQPGS